MGRDVWSRSARLGTGSWPEGEETKWDMPNTNSTRLNKSKLTQKTERITTPGRNKTLLLAATGKMGSTASCPAMRSLQKADQQEPMQQMTRRHCCWSKALTGRGHRWTKHEQQPSWVPHGAGDYKSQTPHRRVWDWRVLSNQVHFISERQ